LKDAGTLRRREGKEEDPLEIIVLAIVFPLLFMLAVVVVPALRVVKIPAMAEKGKE
jgi:hypothetical protein